MTTPTPVGSQGAAEPYTYPEMLERVAEMNKGGLVLSNQYGMLMILDANDRILLNVSRLVSFEERMKHA